VGPAVDGQWRSSHPGVFAVGNLVHPGQTADTAALHRQAAAQHVVDYLGSGGHFILRVVWPLEKPELLLRQGERLVLRRRFCRMLANLPYALLGRDLEQLDPLGGPLQLTLAAN